jgi:hypothetical protein
MGPIVKKGRFMEQIEVVSWMLRCTGERTTSSFEASKWLEDALSKLFQELPA